MPEALIVEAVRTPRGKGKPGGALSGVAPVELAAGLVRHLLTRQTPAAVDDLILGCSTQTGEQGTNVARLAALAAGLETSGSTVSRYCASGIDAIAAGAAQICASMAASVFAGGIESMSRVPMFSDAGPWFADPTVAEIAGFMHMGVSADLLATDAGIDKPALDAYAVESHRRARRARDEGWNHAIVPVETEHGTVHADEAIRDLDLDAAASRPPAFGALFDEDAQRRLARWRPDAQVDPRHSVATSPGLADAASLLWLVSSSSSLADRAVARIASWSHETATVPMSLAGNVSAVRSALARAGWSVDQVDAFEVNESFAAVPIHFARTLRVDPASVAAHGGAIAMGHPLGATGGILVATLLDVLSRTGGRRGVASVCGAAGVASAIAIERL
ncbi:MAG: acetyl-CoA C-acyltransferase [Sandaracinaceae bacterium]